MIYRGPSLDYLKAVLGETAESLERRDTSGAFIDLGQPRFRLAATQQAIAREREESAEGPEE